MSLEGGGSIRVGSDDLEWPWKAGCDGSYADLLNNALYSLTENDQIRQDSTRREGAYF